MMAESKYEIITIITSLFRSDSETCLRNHNVKNKNRPSLHSMSAMALEAFSRFQICLPQKRPVKIAVCDHF